MKTSPKEINGTYPISPQASEFLRVCRRMSSNLYARSIPQLATQYQPAASPVPPLLSMTEHAGRYQDGEEISIWKRREMSRKK